MLNFVRDYKATPPFLDDELGKHYYSYIHVNTVCIYLRCHYFMTIYVQYV
jgi:hypothetical protein